MVLIGTKAWSRMVPNSKKITPNFLPWTLRRFYTQVSLVEHYLYLFLLVALQYSGTCLHLHVLQRKGAVFLGQEYPCGKRNLRQKPRKRLVKMRILLLLRLKFRILWGCQCRLIARMVKRDRFRSTLSLLISLTSFCIVFPTIKAVWQVSFKPLFSS